MVRIFDLPFHVHRERFASKRHVPHMPTEYRGHGTRRWRVFYGFARSMSRRSRYFAAQTSVPRIMVSVSCLRSSS